MKSVNCDVIPGDDDYLLVAWSGCYGHTHLDYSDTLYQFQNDGNDTIIAWEMSYTNKVLFFKYQSIYLHKVKK